MNFITQRTPLQVGENHWDPTVPMPISLPIPSSLPINEFIQTDATVLSQPGTFEPYSSSP